MEAMSNYNSLNMFIWLQNLITENKEEVFVLWKWLSSQRKDREQKFMALEQEWAVQAEEKFWLQEEQKEEQN